MRRIVVLFGVLFILAGSELYAGKIGVVDMQEVLLKSKAGREAKEVLEKEKEERKKELDARKSEIDKMEQELNRQSLVLSEDVKRKRQEEIAQKKQEFLKILQKYEAELQKKDEEFTQKILGEVEKVIYKIGKTEGYDLIIEKSAVLYAPESYDITEKVIKEYDRTFGR